MYPPVNNLDDPLSKEKIVVTRHGSAAWEWMASRNSETTSPQSLESNPANKYICKVHFIPWQVSGERVPDQVSAEGLESPAEPTTESAFRPSTPPQAPVVPEDIEMEPEASSAEAPADQEWETVDGAEAAASEKAPEAGAEARDLHTRVPPASLKAQDLNTEALIDDVDAAFPHGAEDEQVGIKCPAEGCSQSSWVW